MIDKDDLFASNLFDKEIQSSIELAKNLDILDKRFKEI